MGWNLSNCFSYFELYYHDYFLKSTMKNVGMKNVGLFL